MRLRYAGTCRGCGVPVAAGQWAVYHREAKQVECLSCAESDSPVAAVNEPGLPPTKLVDTSQAEEEIPAGIESTAQESAPIDPGTAGASARREHRRRVTKREARIRTAHPRIGGLILAVTEEPQTTTAWARGARGEELLAKRLDDLRDRGVLMLHDRRIPGAQANIDHIAVSPAGVFVIDAKRYKGRPHMRYQGGLLRARTETLMIGSRDCSKLLDGVTKQVALVRSALDTAGQPAELRVRGMLCFVDADWPLIGGSFTTAGVDVLWQKKAAERICESAVLTSDATAGIHQVLASAFPVA
jgi:hypothetical protein